jgi:hypothetical protein
LEKDIEIKEELNNRQIVYLKNRINDLEVNGPQGKSRRCASSIDPYGSIETASLSGAPIHYGSIHYSKSENEKHEPVVNFILLDEYHRVQAALGKLQQFIHSQTKLDIAPSIEELNQFKCLVLDKINDWNSKTEGIASIIKRHAEKTSQYSRIVK